MWSELAENVGRQLSMAEEEDARVRLMLRLGALRESRMGAVEAAIEIYREVLDRDPTNAAALASLERLVLQPEHEVRVAEILEPLYRDSGEVRKLIGIHEIQVKHSSEPDQKVDLLGRMAELYEVQLEDLNNAFHCYARALAEDPGNHNTQEQLERIAGSARRVAAARGDLRSAAPAHRGRARRGQLARQGRGRARDQARRCGGAIAHYKRVLEHDETSLDAAERARTAVPRRAALRRARRRVPDQGRDARRRRDAQKEHYFRAGQLYEEVLDRPDQAIEVYQKSLQVEPDDVEALDKLIALCCVLRRWESARGVHAQGRHPRRRRSEEGALRRGRRGLRARARPDRQGDRDYQRILEIDPQDATAIARLDALYQATRELGRAAVDPGARSRARVRSERRARVPLPHRRTVRAAALGCLPRRRRVQRDPRGRIPITRARRPRSSA